MVGGAGCSWEWTLALLLCIIIYDWIHKKTAWGILLMGGCRTLLWITAATAASGMSPAPLLYVWAIAVGAYVMGISWYARNESYRQKEEDFDRLVDRIPILFLFGVPMLALAYLVLWNNLDPVRVFLVNLAGLLAGGVAFFAILKMKQNTEGSLAIGVSIARRYLCGRCHNPFLPCTAFGWALCAPRSNCSYFAKEVCGNLGFFYIGLLLYAQ